ncbi:hypothetical protein Dimus_023858 [Dionaea muscipula]
MALRGAITIGRKATPSLLLSKSPLFNNTKSLNSSTHHHLRHGRLLYSSPPRDDPKAGFRYSIRALHGSTVEPVAPLKKVGDEQHYSHDWKIKMLYDGDCPLCMREVNMLRQRNKQYGAIKFVDISSEDYSPEENQGLDYKTVMGRIHAILSDGTVLTDVEVWPHLNSTYLFNGAPSSLGDISRLLSRVSLK